MFRETSFKIFSRTAGLQLILSLCQDLQEVQSQVCYFRASLEWFYNRRSVLYGILQEVIENKFCVKSSKATLNQMKTQTFLNCVESIAFFCDHWYNSYIRLPFWTLSMVTPNVVQGEQALNLKCSSQALFFYKVNVSLAIKYNLAVLSKVSDHYPHICLSLWVRSYTINSYLIVFRWLWRLSIMESWID
jgi:hypothetical protein